MCPSEEFFQDKILTVGAQSFLVLPIDAAIKCNLNKPHVIISITDPGAHPVKFEDNPNRLGLLRLSFSDVKENISPKVQRMTMEQGNQVVDFVEQHNGANPIYVIHCTAGISRSPAVAAAIAALNGANVLCFWEKFLPNGHVFGNILTCHAMKKWGENKNDPLFT